MSGDGNGEVQQQIDIISCSVRLCCRPTAVSSIKIINAQRQDFTAALFEEMEKCLSHLKACSGPAGAAAAVTFMCHQKLWSCVIDDNRHQLRANRIMMCTLIETFDRVDNATGNISAFFESNEKLNTA